MNHCLKLIKKKEEEQKRIFTAYRENIIGIDLFKDEYKMLEQAIAILNREADSIKEKINESKIINDEEYLYKKYVKIYKDLTDSNKIEI